MEKKKILITGANGQVGKGMIAALKDHPTLIGFAHGRDSFDLSNTEQMKTVFKSLSPDAVINTAAYTAVDAAEDDESTSVIINAAACQTLAELCQSTNIPLFHYSSDYVYHNGIDRPLLETDELNPQSVYAKTKLQGEKLIQAHCTRHFIMRTSWVYDAQGQNFVRTMLALSEKYPALTVVDDQIGSPTYAPDIAKATLAILSAALHGQLSDTDYGVYNFSNEGVCSWFDFAHAIFDLAKKTTVVNPVPSTAYPRPAARPHYSVMNKEKIRKILPYGIPHWRTSLIDCLSAIK